MLSVLKGKDPDQLRFFFVFVWFMNMNIFPLTNNEYAFLLFSVGINLQNPI